MRHLFFFIACCAAMAAQAQKDFIMFRDGTEKQVHVIQVNSNVTLYSEGKGKNAQQKSTDNKDIYMIKYEKRGNVFFTESGDYFTGPSVRKFPKGTVIIYFKRGAEILGYDFQIGSQDISYKMNAKKKTPVTTVPKSEVFLIRHSDGTKDVMTNYVQSQKAVEEPASASPISSATLAPKERTHPTPVSPVAKERTFPAPATIKLKKSGKAVDAIVYSDNVDGIEYKRASNPNGPMYKHTKGEVSKITYKD